MAKPTVETVAKVSLDIVEKGLIRVLHVDDELSFLKSAKQVLEMQGNFQVETASSVEEAMEKMKEREFDVIVSDYIMPEKSGLEFLKKLRESGDKIPFIIFTGKGREEIAIEALNLGADRYFNKIGHPEAVYGELAHGIRRIVNEKKAEEELAKSEMKYRSLVENVGTGIATTDLEGRFVFVNQALCEMLGYSERELIGKPFADFLHPDDKEKILQIFLETWENPDRRLHLEFRALHKKGHIVHMYSSPTVTIYEKEIIGFNAIISDITERKKAEEALRQSEEKWRSLAENIPSFVSIIDKNCRILSINRTVKLSQKKIIGSNVCNYIAPKYRPLLKKKIKEVFKSGKATNLRTENIYGLWYENYIGPIFHNGEATNVIMISQDITEQKKTEESRLESEERYRELTESIKDVFFAMDKNLRYTYWNKASEKLTDISATDAIGKSLTEVFPDVKGPEIEKFYLDVLRTKRHQTLVNEYRVGDKDFVFEIDAYPTKDGLSVFVKDITERKKTESERTRLLHGLNERVKELRCLYGISKLVEKSDISLDEIMHETTHLLPPAWQYPDITCARIIFENQEFRTDNFKETQWRQCSDIEVYGKKVGFVEVCYLEEKPTIAEGPFSKEERDLIDAITERLGRITQRIEAEGKVETERKKLRDIIEAMADSVCITGLDDKITMVNNAMVDLFQVSREKFLTLRGFDLATKEDVPKISKAMQDLFKTGLPQNVEVTGRLSGAKDRPFWMKFSLLKDEKGGPVGIVTVARDITERKKMEQELWDARQKWVSLMENTDDVIMILDDKGTIQYVNLTPLAANPRETVGKSVYEYVPREQHDILRESLIKVFKTGKPDRYEVSPCIPGIGTLWFSTKVVPIKHDRKTVRVILISTDITERKKTEEALKESQEKFERLFTGNPEPAIYTDSEFHLLDVNPRFKELFGYSLDEIKGKHIDDIIVPMDKIGEAEMLNKKAKKGYVYHDTFRRRKDGSLVPVSISAAPITVEKQLIGYVAVYKDISQLKETLGKLEMMNEKSRVAGNLTRHDARNKLSTVTMNTFLAKQKLTENHEAMQYLSEVESAVEQVEGIFEFARIYEKLGMEELAYMDVEKIFGESVSLFSDLKDIEVMNDCRGLKVLADSLLRQLFYNLIDNSLKYGEKVSRIRVYCEEEGTDQLKMIYEDDGNGIPKTEKKKIFEEGYGKGTGYGLYLIKKMCEVYGWTIQETGKPDKGAQFTITIPKMNENGRTNYQLH